MDPDPRWLTEEDQRVWRRWLLVQNRIAAELNRQLQTESALSLQDFDVLVRLTDEVPSKIRITELAVALGWERSRLSHHIRRMEKRNLIQREECPDDGRGAFVVLTDTGRAVIEAAAPAHVHAVRRIFDALSYEQLQMLDMINRKVLGQLKPPTG
jgi:DNA-binding MarR family transcriptional regulator